MIYRRLGLAAAALSLGVAAPVYAQSTWNIDQPIWRAAPAARNADQSAWRVVQTTWHVEQSSRSVRSPRSSALNWELKYLALSAIDTAQTIECLDRGLCEEANPLFGKHPSSAKLIAAKAVFGAAHFAVFNRLNERDPHAAMRFAQGSVIMQGGVVALNARFAF